MFHYPRIDKIFVKGEISMIIKLTNQKDFDEIIKNNKNVVVDFNATWCGPCRMMGRVIEEIEGEYKDLCFLKVDTDDFMELAQRFSIVSIPAFYAFKNGKMISFSFNGNKETMHVGGMDEDDFKLMLNETFSL